jgi:hypothetical protein
MIEGRPPFAAESPMATMLKHVKSKVPPPRTASRETSKVILAALRKNREKRVQTCGRFAELLGQAIGAARAVKEGRETVPPVQLQRRATSTGPIAPVTDYGTGSMHVGSDGPNKLVIIGLLAGVLALGLAAAFVDFGGEEPETEAAPAATGETGAPELAEDSFPFNRSVIRTNVEGASVLVDGAEVCTSPCEVQIPVGDGKPHEIKLSKDGYVDVVTNWQPKTVVEEPPELPPMTPTRRAVGG